MGTDFEKDLTKTINNVLEIMREKEIIKFKARVNNLHISKVILQAEESYEDIEENGTSLSDLTPNSQFHLKMDVDFVDSYLSGSFDGNFYIKGDHSIVPLGKDETAAIISPEQLQNSNTIAQEAMEILKKHWQDIWEGIQLAISVYLTLVEKGLI